MRENGSKREALLVGPWRKRPHEAPAGIADHYAADGEAIITLGVPIGNELDIGAWWTGRINTVALRMGQLRTLAGKSFHARKNVLQTKWYGSFRYWLFSLRLPKGAKQRIERGAQASQLLCSWSFPLSVRGAWTPARWSPRLG